jgi:hypothetical protein
MTSKFALIIANTEYSDPGLEKLTAPRNDANDLAQILEAPEIGGFDHVKVLLNRTESEVREMIDDFFAQKGRDDLLLLYFSGHGVRDDQGALYLAVKNTNRSKLRSTAIKSDFIKESMDQSRSRRQVLILDCCNSGAFAQGTKAEIGGSMGTKTAFEGIGYGRVILTASDATQFAWEGDKVVGSETDNSLFTYFLVEGLKGHADLDGDGVITIDELYQYAHDQIVSRTPKQTPKMWSFGQEGKIVLRGNIRMAEIKPIPLPGELTVVMENPLSLVREGVVRQLEELAKGKNLGLARSAIEALEKMAMSDDSSRVKTAALAALDSLRKSEITMPPGLIVGEPKVAPKQNIVNEKPIEVVIPPQVQKQEPLLAPKVEKQEPVVKPDTSAGVKKSKMPILVGSAIGLAVTLLIAWLILVQMMFSSPNSAVAAEGYSDFQGIQLSEPTYDDVSFFRSGMTFTMNFNTFYLKDDPCQVIVYFEDRQGNRLMGSKTLLGINNPYIGTDGSILVFDEVTPPYANTHWNVKLFMPYIALSTAGLPTGENFLRYRVQVLQKSTGRIISISDYKYFTYTRP